MLTPTKKRKLTIALKSYRKKYLGKKFADLDESGTRLMINEFLTEVLGFISIEEIKTEYMIRGTYADYVIQIKGKQHFLIEVKALSINLSSKHLKQATDYGANEGIEWVLLTNGRAFEFYRVLFNKPIESKQIFSIDLNETQQLNSQVEVLQYLHKESILKKRLDILWNKHLALETTNIAGLLYTKTVVNFLKRELKKKFKNRFDDAEIIEAINVLLTESININDIKSAKAIKKKS